jgi:hypothetical protein
MRTLTKILAGIALSISVAVAPVVGSSMDAEAALSKYRDKFVVVMDEGLSIGSQPGVIHRAGWSFGSARSCLAVAIAGLEKSSLKAVLMPQMPGETGCAVDSLHKGEVLKVLHVSFHSPYLSLDLQSLSPHSITRGLGAFAHQSLEIGEVHIAILAGDKGKDLGAADALAAHWFKLATSADAAAPEFGNTASGAFVSQVKAGMSFAEVEQALGVPQTRVDLGEKVLYKYKDMTVEFHDGRVTDVR